MCIIYICMFSVVCVHYTYVHIHEQSVIETRQSKATRCTCTFVLAVVIQHNLICIFCRWENAIFVSVSSERTTRGREGLVWMPIKGGISLFKVSVPLSSLSSQQRARLLTSSPHSEIVTLFLCK